jgi:ferredoxin
VSEKCGGCGVCIPKCPANEITYKLLRPPKPKLEDYYEGITLKL